MIYKWHTSRTQMATPVISSVICVLGKSNDVKLVTRTSYCLKVRENPGIWVGVRGKGREGKRSLFLLWYPNPRPDRDYGIRNLHRNSFCDVSMDTTSFFTNSERVIHQPPKKFGVNHFLEVHDIVKSTHFRHNRMLLISFGKKKIRCSLKNQVTELRPTWGHIAWYFWRFKSLK